jgi:hypothetical protein
MVDNAVYAFKKVEGDCYCLLSSLSFHLQYEERHFRPLTSGFKGFLHIAFKINLFIFFSQKECVWLHLIVITILTCH